MFGTDLTHHKAFFRIHISSAEEAGFSQEAALAALTGLVLDTHLPITTHLIELSDVQVDSVTVKSFSVSGTLLLTSEDA